MFSGDDMGGCGYVLIKKRIKKSLYWLNYDSGSFQKQRFESVRLHYSKRYRVLSSSHSKRICGN